MNIKKLVLATVVAGVVANVLDFVVHGMILGGTYAQNPSLFRQDVSPLWFIVGDFVAVFVFLWVYDRVYSSFGGGPKGGATFGLFAGILVNFPSWIFAHLMFVGYGYSLSWTMTIYGIVWAIVVGAVAGALYKK